MAIFKNEIRIWVDVLPATKWITRYFIMLFSFLVTMLVLLQNVIFDLWKTGMELVFICNKLFFMLSSPNCYFRLCRQEEILAGLKKGRYNSVYILCFLILGYTL